MDNTGTKVEQFDGLARGDAGLEIVRAIPLDVEPKAYELPELRPLHPLFAAAVRGFDTRAAMSAHRTAYVEQAIALHAVLVFKDQSLTDEQQVAFSQAFGTLHKSIITNRGDIQRSVRIDEVSEITNVGPDGAILPPSHASRMQQRANLLWHTDNSFRKPAGGYTLLNARMVTPADGETEFADMRAAYDALSPAMKVRIGALRVRHSLARSRELAGTAGVFDTEERARFPPTVQPLVRRHEISGRLSLYLGSPAEGIVGLAAETGWDLIAELTAFATQPRFVYRHSWAVGDLVMWDNRATLHRALPFEDQIYRRDMRRTSTMVAPEHDVGEVMA